MRVGFLSNGNAKCGTTQVGGTAEKMVWVESAAG